MILAQQQAHAALALSNSRDVEALSAIAFAFTGNYAEKSNRVPGFLRSLERRRHQHPDSQGSKGRVLEADLTCPTGATWFTATSASVDLKKNEVEYTRPDGQRARLSYAHLVLACGS